MLFGPDFSTFDGNEKAKDSQDVLVLHDQLLRGQRKSRGGHLLSNPLDGLSTDGLFRRDSRPLVAIRN